MQDVLSSNLLLRVLCVDRVVMEKEIKMAIFPGTAGEFAVLAHHENLIASINGGIILIHGLDGVVIKLYASAGTLHVLDNVCSICVDDAFLLDKLSLDDISKKFQSVLHSLEGQAEHSQLEKTFLLRRKETYEKLSAMCA